MMFGTASWNRTVEPTGIRNQVEGVSYGEASGRSTASRSCGSSGACSRQARRGFGLTRPFPR